MTPPEEEAFIDNPDDDPFVNPQIYEVDGVQYSFPRNVTEAEVLAFFNQKTPDATSPAPAAAPAAPVSERPGDIFQQPLTDAERERSGMGQRFLEGVAAPGVALAQLFGSEDTRRKIAQYQRDRELGMMKQGISGNYAGGLGQLASFLVPGAGATKLAQVAAALGKAQGLNLAQRAGLAAMKAPSGWVGGGVTSGILTPVEGQDANENFANQKAWQVGTAGAIGGGLQLAMPYVGAAAKVGSESVGDLWRAYRPNKGPGGTYVAEKLVRENIPQAERQSVIDAINARKANPSEYAGMTSEQVLRAQGVAPTFVELSEKTRQMPSGQHAAYVKQQRGLMGEGEDWLQGVAGTPEQRLAQDAINDRALSEAIDKTRDVPIKIKSSPIEKFVVEKIRETQKTKQLEDAAGNIVTSATGKALKRTSGEVVATDLNKVLRDVEGLLHETYTPAEFTARMQRVAAEALPVSGNIQVKGFSNKINAILGKMSKNGTDATMEALEEVRLAIKAANMGTDEIGRAVVQVKRAVKDGPVHLTESPDALIQIRTRLDKEILDRAGSPHEAGVLRDVKKKLDETLGNAIPAYRAALSQRVVSGDALRKQEVAAALLDTMQKAGKGYTPERFLQAMQDSTGFVGGVTKGPKLAEETLEKYFPGEAERFTRMQTIRRGVGETVAPVDLPGAATMGARVGSPTPHIFTRAASMAGQAKHLGYEKLEESSQEAWKRIQDDPELLLDVLNRAKREKWNERVVDLLTKSAMAKTYGRAIIPGLAAKSYQ